MCKSQTLICLFRKCIRHFSRVLLEVAHKVTRKEHKPLFHFKNITKGWVFWEMGTPKSLSLVVSSRQRGNGAYEFENLPVLSILVCHVWSMPQVFWVKKSKFHTILHSLTAFSLKYLHLCIQYVHQFLDCNHYTHLCLPKPNNIIIEWEQLVWCTLQCCMCVRRFFLTGSKTEMYRNTESGEDFF